MAISLTDAKAYLRVDGDDEDALITRLIAVSEAYLSGAVDEYSERVLDATFAAKAEMVQLAVIADMFENRNQGGAEVHPYGRIIESLIRQLQLWPVNGE